MTRGPEGDAVPQDDVVELTRQLEQVAQREATFRALLDDSSDPIFALEADGTYRYVNQAFADGVARPRERIIGHRIWDVFEPTEAARRFAALRDVFDTGLTKVFEVHVPRADGDRYYLTTVKPVLGEGGGVVSTLCISKEITERKRMEVELQRRLAELEQALAHVRRLQGIIPICVHCHSVRRDPETWQRLDAYVAEHSDAKFSHGICPNCLERHYASSGLT